MISSALGQRIKVNSAALKLIQYKGLKEFLGSVKPA
jgi:hypothetical protein